MKILFFCSSIGLGHKIRVAKLIAALHANGVDCDLAMAAAPNNDLLRLCPLHEYFETTEISLQQSGFHHIGTPAQDDLHAAFLRDNQIIDRSRPSVIVYDWRPTIPASATLYQIPVVAVFNYCWGAFHGLQPEFSSQLTASLNEIALDRETALAEFYRTERIAIPASSVLNLVADAEEFVSPNEIQPKHTFFTGPIVPRGDPLKITHVENGRVFIHFGGHELTPLHGVLENLLSKAGLLAVLPQAPAVSATKLDELFPQDLWSCNAVITHGGSGSVYQSLYAGKPLIVIPQHIEHEWYGRCVERLGLGKVLYEAELKERLIPALTALAHHPFRHEDQRMFNDDGAQRAANRILETFN